MSFTDDYNALKKKRKKQEKEKVAASSGTKFEKQYYTEKVDREPVEEDIAPVRKTADEPVLAAKMAQKQDTRRWFEKGAFEDGYQFGDVLRTLSSSSQDLGNSVTAGLLGIGEKVVDAGAYIVGGAAGLLGNDKLKDKTEKFIEKDLYDEKKLAKKLNAPSAYISNKILGIDDVDEDSALGEKTDALAQSGGQLLGTAALQAAGVPWYLTSGVTSFGSEAEGALNEGATFGRAGASAAISAGAEILTEKLFGGSGLGEKGLINLEALTNGISSKAVKLLADYGVDMAAEGSEEVISQFMSNLGSALYKEENLGELLASEEALDGYLESFIGGAALGGVANTGKVIHSAQTGRDYRTELTDNEQRVVDRVYEERVAEAEKSGEKLSKKDKDKIYNSVLEDMDKGYIDTDTIESVLGGEDYSNYQREVKRQQDIDNELNELRNMKSGDMTDIQAERMAELKTMKPNTEMMDSLKFNVDEKVRAALGQNSRLSESYAERARRGQQFEADLSKYDEKQRAVVQKAIDSGVLNNTNRTREFVDMVAKISADKGVLFDFTNNEKLKETSFAVDGATVNGFVTKDGITVNIDSHKAVNSVVGHEITHVLEGTELYAELQTALFEYAKGKGDYQGRYDTLAKLYEGVEGADVDAELTADLVGDYLFTDSDFINNLSTKHRNVFQKVYDEIKYLCKIATAGSKEARELERVKRAFETAYAESGKSAEGTKYSISDKNIKDVSTGYASGESYYTMSYTQDGKVVGTLEYGEYNGEPNVKMIEVAPEYRRQGIGTKLLQELQKKYPDTEIDFGMSTPDGTKLLDAITYDVTDEAVVADRQKLKDLQTELNDLQEKLDVLFDTETLTEAQETELHELGDRWQEVYETIRELEKSVRGKRATKTFVKTDTKYSLSDSDGKQLTKEQSEYFKDSKIRDDNGKLKVMHHGTNESFTVFDKNKARYSGTYGKGFYFTDSTSHAATYGELLDVYLNITNPLQNGTNNITKDQIRKFVEAIAENEDYGIDNYGYDATIDSVTDSVYGKSDFGIILDLNISCIGDMVEAVELFNKVNGTNYDGIIAPTETVAFYPEQIKRIDNEAPTSNPDIRYSLSEKQQEYFKDSKVRDEDGKLKAVYHGSPSEFNEFSLKYLGTNGTNEGYGFYFTDSKRIADGYSKGENGNGKLFEVYLDIKKPLSDTEVTISKAQFKKLLVALNNQVDADGERLDILSNYGDVEWEGLNKVLNYAIELEYDGNDNDVDIISSLVNSSGNLEAVYRVLREVTGYDGIIVNEAEWGGDQTIYIAFHPEQIKNVDNLNPTDDPDIRHSLSAEGETPREYGKWNVYGKDIRYNPAEELAPVQDLNDSVQDLNDSVQVAPVDKPESAAPSAVGLAEIAKTARREEMRGAYVQDGKQYISNGSFIAELNTVDESLEQSENFPIKRVQKELAEVFDRQIDGKYELDTSVTDGYIKVGDSLFDAKYVNAAVSAIENPEFSLSAVRGGDNALLVTGDNGRVVLMPVRASENANVAYEAQRVDDVSDIAPSEPSLQELRQKQDALYEELQAAIESEDAEAVSRIGAEYDSTARAVQQMEADESERFASLDDADAPPEVDAPYYSEDVETADPFENRDMKEVSRDRKVKAYMYENPEVKPFFQEEARVLLGELENGIKGERIYTPTPDGRPGVYGAESYGFYTGVKRHVSPEIAHLLDDVKMSYADIEKGLKAIIEDNGAENIAAAKKIEFVLNERLLNGYQEQSLGMEIPPNQDYINLINEKQITAYTDEARQSFFESVGATDIKPDVEDIAPVAEKYESIRPPKQTAEPRMKRAEPRMKRVDSEDARRGGEKERRWYETSTGSEAVDGMVTPDDIPDDVRYYKVKPNKKTLATANARLERDGYAKSREYFEGRMTERKLTVEDIALGERLIQEAAKAGDAKAVRDLIIDVSILGTELGQRVQALSMIRRLTPEGQLKALYRTVERGKAKGDKAFDGVKVTEDMENRILETYKEDGTFEQAELDRAVEDVKQQIADQMPVSALDYINAWRYLSMLGNPKTHIRNVVSNVAMYGTRAVKNAIARTAEDIVLRNKKPVLNTDDIAPTAYDTAKKGEVEGQQKAFSEAKATRTKTWKRASDAVKAFAKQTTLDMESAIKGDTKYSEEGSIKAKRQIFKTGAANWVNDKNTNALEGEDFFFSRPAFENSLREFLTANGIETEADTKNNPELVEAAKDYALEEARKATFRQDSYLANKIAEIEKKNAAFGVAIGSVMPFKKTPINIAKTGVAYSPLGLARNIYDYFQVRKGNMDVTEAIDHVAQTLTGSSLFVMGIALASMGVLNGAGSDDKEGKYDYQLGKQSYSFNWGGDSFSLSWLSPVSMPLFVGANAYEKLVEKEKWDLNVLFDAAAQTLDPLSEMSFLSSLDDVLSSYDSGMGKIMGAGESMIQNYATQFIPTLSSQVAATFDDTKRSTKASGTSGWEFGEETLKKIAYKIPGARNLLAPTTDIWGNDAKQTENFFARGFESFLSPANRRAGIATEVDEEIKELYRQTGDSGVIPSIPYDYINYDGVKYDMSAMEFVEYKHTYGQTAFELMEKLFDTNTYRNATSEERAEMVNRVYDYARDAAKRDFLDGYDVDYTNAQKDGVEVFKENAIKGAIEADLPVDEYEFSRDYPAKYRFFKNNGISYDTYKAADEDGKRAYTWAYDNPGKYTLSKAISDDFMEFYGYKDAMNDFDAKDANGETVSGLKKERVTNYINGLDLDYGQRIILFRMMYDGKADQAAYNMDIVDYLNSRQDISYEETVTILKELGFTVDAQGNIYW